MYTKSEISRFMRENDVKFIRFAFCDFNGKLKNVGMPVEGLSRVIENGISFNGSFFGYADGDLYLHPELDTVTILPWRPERGRVARFMCDIKYPDGRQFGCDGRHILRNVEKELSDMGYTARVGVDCEFYLYTFDSENLKVTGAFDNAGYLDIAPPDRGENIRREICLTMEEMGISPERSFHEAGDGQNEIDFRCDTPLITADNFVKYKTVVGSVAQKNGLYSDFSPLGYGGTAKEPSGLHFDISLEKNGINIFENETEEAKSFTEGILRRLYEMSAFLCMTEHSYRRLEITGLNRIAWSRRIGDCAVRIPMDKLSHSRVEVRCSDPLANPYLALSMLIRAGMDGIKDKLSLRASFGDAPEFGTMPESISSAVEAANGSEFIKGFFTDGLTITTTEKNGVRELYMHL